LEDYTLTHAGNTEGVAELGKGFLDLFSNDPVWGTIEHRLVVVSDETMSYFVQHACEVAQHVRINDATGTAELGALFNQENVPSETLFYSVIHFSKGRGEPFKNRNEEDAISQFSTKVEANTFQIGGDASTGLGFCSVLLWQPRNGNALTVPH
jgi:CRISPR-associated protein Cmr4